MALQELSEPQHMTEDEYLAFEVKAENRHEYIDGLVVPMASHWNHSRLCVNTGVTLHRQLSNSDYAALMVSMRVGMEFDYVSYRYPDVLVAHHDKVAFFRGRDDALANPTVIAEVYTDDTELLDRSQKMDEYLQIESLQEYILIADSTTRIEQYVRHDRNKWLYKKVTDEPGQILLTSVDCYLTLADVYRDIDFDLFSDNEPDDTDTEEDTDA
jgi:Uma2 family endonuclease